MRIRLYVGDDDGKEYFEIQMSESDVGLGMKIRNALMGLEKSLKEALRLRDEYLSEITAAKHNLEQDAWEYADEYAALREEAALLK